MSKGPMLPRNVDPHAVAVVIKLRRVRREDIAWQIVEQSVIGAEFVMHKRETRCALIF